MVVNNKCFMVSRAGDDSYLWVFRAVFDFLSHIDGLGSPIATELRVTIRSPFEPLLTTDRMGHGEALDLIFYIPLVSDVGRD